MSKLTEKLLSSGWWVRLRPVPPLAQGDVLDLSQYVHPPVPMQEVKTKVGVEYVSYAPSHPEMHEWHLKCDKLDSKRNDAGADFSYSYGIHSWSEDQETWLTGVDNGWEIDPAFVRMLKDGTEFYRRLAFIKSELILSPQDMQATQEVIYSIRPVSDADLNAMEDLFRDPIQLGAFRELLDQLEDVYKVESLSGDDSGKRVGPDAS